MGNARTQNLRLRFSPSVFADVSKYTKAPTSAPATHALPLAYRRHALRAEASAASVNCLAGDRPAMKFLAVDHPAD